MNNVNTQDDYKSTGSGRPHKYLFPSSNSEYLMPIEKNERSINIEEDFELKTNNAKEFIKKLQIDKRIRERRYLIQQKKEEEIIHKEIANDEKHAQELMEKRRNQLKVESMRKHKELREMRQKELELLMIHKKSLRSIPINARLYKKLEMKSNLEVLNKSEGEQKKIKERINKEEILKHEKSYKSILVKNALKWKDNWDKLQEQELAIREQQKKYCSIIMRSVKNFDNKKLLLKSSLERQRKSIKTKYNTILTRKLQLT